MKPEKGRSTPTPAVALPEGGEPRLDSRDEELHRLREALSAARALLREREEELRARAAAPLADGGAEQLAAERRVTMDALQRSEALLHTVTRNYPRGVVGLFDRDLRLILVDGRGTGTGTGPGWLVGMDPATFAPPSAVPKLVAAFGEALAGREGKTEVRIGDRTLEVETFPVRDPDGGVALGMVMTEDVTERREAEARLQVSSRLAVLGTLVAGVAHEVNNPLGGALASQGFAIEDLGELREGLRAGTLDALAVAARIDDVLEALRDAQDASQRIARIVHDLTSFGRADASRIPVRLEEEVEAAAGWVARPGTVALRLERTPAPPVLASVEQLRQVIANVVDNAVKAIPAGRAGVITVRTGPGREGTARVEVSDDGVGMSPEVRNRVFDPFFTTRKVGQGTGLGLAVAHAIVTAHGGTISVESEPGKGSTFRIELPAILEEK